MFSRRGPVSAATLQKATQSLHHRGPDGQRQWISPDRSVGLGHARLSIIDLTTGDQPIASEDGRKHIIVNGEFYGYEAIQRDLQARGHRLSTKSDSEIALHLYEDFGVQCLEHLRGEFALLLWDENRRRLFAARDRFGIKPLFYARHNDTLTWPRRSRRCLSPECRHGGTKSLSTTTSRSARLSCERCMRAFSRSLPGISCW